MKAIRWIILLCVTISGSAWPNACDQQQTSCAMQAGSNTTVLTQCYQQYSACVVRLLGNDNGTQYNPLLTQGGPNTQLGQQQQLQNLYTGNQSPFFPYPDYGFFGGGFYQPTNWIAESYLQMMFSNIGGYFGGFAPPPPVVPTLTWQQRSDILTQARAKLDPGITVYWVDNTLLIGGYAKSNRRANHEIELLKRIAPDVPIDDRISIRPIAYQD